MCYTRVLQTIEKQTSDCKEQNCNIYLEKNVGPRAISVKLNYQMFDLKIE